MIRIAIVDDNTFLQKAVAEKLSFFEDLTLKYTAINGNDLIEKLEKILKKKLINEIVL